MASSSYTSQAIAVLAVRSGVASASSGRRYLTPLSGPRARHVRRLVVTCAADSSSPASVAAAGNKTIVTDDEFSLAKVSFGVIGLAVGGSLLSYGFGAYFTILPGSEWSAIMLTYGFPLTIIGMALKYAELKPVPCITFSDAEALREKCATPILKQVRSDVIRYRYGDEQHLDEALQRIFQYGLGGGVPRRNAPKLQMIREEVTEEGKYSLALVFEAKALELSDFEKRQAKFTSFFGPGIIAEIGQLLTMFFIFMLKICWIYLFMCFIYLFILVLFIYLFVFCRKRGK
ncbi:hypothetical protein LUZ60_013666 [Juncus effusus]|nr:hypothetical protein LUZ60_013666 [Juncus effusus]